MIVELADEVPEHERIHLDASALIAQAEFLGDVLGLHGQTELSILLVGVDRMRELHVEWMDEEGPTDVLSFPMDELREPAPGEPAEAGVLGDIVLCPQVAFEQARVAGHSLEAELELLLTHGILHLLGHDHAEPDAHAVMFARQGELLTEWRERPAR